MNNDNSTASIACIGVAVGAVAVLAISAIVNGMALVLLWKWFVVTQFGLEPLSIPVAIGLSMLISMMAGSRSNSDNGFAEQALGSILSSIFAMIIGYIVFQFV